ncbi:MAG: hypothetical protein KGZ50_09235 [Peptococcaceae bacterium]|nr:hypothetical protein [Peptococcaceae bacterium]
MPQRTCWQHGIRSSLEDELGRNTELIWLLKSLHTDHKAIAEFKGKRGTLRHEGTVV